MPSKIGPDLESHPKIRHAWSLHHSSLGLHLLGLSFAQRTGGFVSTAFVNEKIPTKRERTQALEALTTVAPGEENPMWAAVEGGWRIHNFAKHAEFRLPEENGELTVKRRDAGRKGAAKRWQTDSKLPSGLPSVANGKTDFCHPGLRELTTAIHRDEVFSLCQKLADGILLNDPKAKVAPLSKGWLDAARLLIDRDERPVEEIERVIAWCQADKFWRANVLSMPKLREKYGQLLLKMNEAGGSGGRESASDLLRAMGGIDE